MVDRQGSKESEQFRQHVRQLETVPTKRFTDAERQTIALKRKRAEEEEAAREAIRKKAELLKQATSPSVTAIFRNAGAEQERRALNASKHSQIYTVIEFLKTCDDPQSIESISRKTSVNLHTLPDVKEWLDSNQKILRDETGRYSYKATYQVKSEDDLLELIQRINVEEGGLDVKDLKNAWTGTDKAIEHLMADKKVLCLRNERGKPRVLFENSMPPSAYPQLDDVFKTLWHRTKIPADPADFQKALLAAGLKTQAEADREALEARRERLAREEEERLRKKKLRGRRRTKLTNTHLPGIDASFVYKESQHS